MAARALRNEEMAGLGIALVAHAALVAWLVLAPPKPPTLPPIERVAVTLAEDTGPEATTPEPSKDPAPESAPDFGTAPPSPAPEPLPQPKPQPVPAPKAVVKQPPVKQAPAKPPVTQPRQGTPGSSSFADMFKDGVPGGSGKGNPDAKPSTQQQSAWANSIGAQLRRPWDSCPKDGPDAELMTVSIAFSLAPDGRVLTVGEPTIGGTVTPLNTPQIPRFRECAVRAVRAVGIFRGLPPDQYIYWRERKIKFANGRIGR